MYFLNRVRTFESCQKPGKMFKLHSKDDLSIFLTAVKKRQRIAI